MRGTGVRALVAFGALVALMAGVASGQAAEGASGGGGGPSAMDTMLRIVGRTHPILVHFPIAMVLVATMIETLRAIVRRPTPARTSIHMLGIGVIAAGAAIGSGWLNGDYENHASNAETMELHRWIGIGGGVVALLAFLFALAASRSRRALMAFRALLLVAAGAIGFTGHLGGNMVYGEGYMLAPLKMGKRPTVTEPRPTPPSAPPVSDVPSNPLAGPNVGTDATPIAVSAASVSFERDVLPIFVARCVECHGEAKVKGGLRLDSLDHVMGAESWVLSIEDPKQSDLVVRVKMHEEDDGAMPPKGERLAPAEIATIESWIASLGMSGTGSGTEMDASGEVDASSTQPTSGASGEVSAANARAVWANEQLEAIKTLRARGARIEPVSVESDLLDVNLSLMSPACDGEVLAALGPIVDRIERLNATGAEVGNADVSLLARGGVIRSLDLNRTRIDDDAAMTLAAMPALETLNVTGTGLTDVGLRTLAASGSLKRVYAAETGVTAAGAESVSEGLAVVLAAPERATRVFLVRHAEKQTTGDDPGLTEAGAKRAQALMTELVAEPIRAVYVTQFARTQQTAQPLAEKLGLTPTVMKASGDVGSHAQEIADAIRGLPRGQVALVAGHSNTVPEIMRALGVAEAVVIDESRYGDLFVVELESGGGQGATLVESRRFGD